MGRIRTIKPEFPQSESMGRVSRDARLLFVLMWTIADDEGRARANSRMLASLLFPYDDDAKDLVDGWLSELERERCIVRYRVEGDSYLSILNWSKHQKIDHPSASKIPPFDESSRILASPREPSGEDLRTKEGIVSTPLSPQGGTSSSAASLFPLPSPPIQEKRKRKGRYESDDIAPENAEYLQKVYERVPEKHPVTHEPIHKGPYATAARAFQAVINAGEATARELMAVGTLYYRAEFLGQEWAERANRVWDSRDRAMMHVSTFYGPEKRPYRQLLPLARELIQRQDAQQLQPAS